MLRIWRATWSARMTGHLHERRRDADGPWLRDSCSASVRTYLGSFSHLGLTDAGSLESESFLSAHFARIASEWC